MKKGLKTLLVCALVFTVFVSTGCEKDPAASFKNPKTIEYKTEKGTTKLTYDDDGTYEEVKSGNYITLKNKDGNFRIDIDYAKSTVEEQEKTKENFSKSTNHTIIDVELNKYKGYVMIDKKYTTAIAYLYLDKENDVVSYIKVSPIMTSNALKELENGTKAEDVLYNQEKVQQILKTVKFEK